MKFALVVLSALGLFGSLLAHADRDRGPYLGFGGLLLDVDAIDISANKVEFKVAELIGGYKLSNWAGIELRAGGAVTDEVILLSDALDAETATVNIAFYYAGYYRVEINNEVAKAYALLGGVEMNVDFYLTDDKDNTFDVRSSSGFSYGAGVGFILGKKMYLNFEWRSLIDSPNNLFTSIGANIDYRF